MCLDDFAENNFVFIGVWLIYNVMKVQAYSKVIKLYIYACFFRFSSHRGHYRALIQVPCATQFSSVQLLSHVQLCNPMDCSMPGLPAYHQLPELTQTHVHKVSDAMQPPHPLSSWSSPHPMLHSGPH